MFIIGLIPEQTIAREVSRQLKGNHYSNKKNDSLNFYWTDSIN